MREKTRQRLLADTTTGDESLPTTTTTPAQRRAYNPMANLSSKARDNLGSSDFAVPGKRKLPINDADHVRAAIARFNQTEGLTPEEKASAKARIRAAAKKFGVEIADDSPIAAEAMLQTYLQLEAVGGIEILTAEGDSDSGVMRVRMPFYVGNSVATLPGFSKKVYFGAAALDGIVAEGNQRIHDRQQPLTVYARHAHATGADRLPVGAVVNLEARGKVGYAEIEIAPTSEGRDVQALIRAKHLNASSLRSGRFEMEERKVNGELMLEPVRLAIDGIDFAPDSPAMPTYGVELLAAEAAVEPAPVIVPRRNTMDDVTVDGLRAEFPQVVAEIEKPLRDELAAVKAERATAIQAETLRKRDEMVESIVVQMPNPDEARPELQKLCAEAPTENDVAAIAMPLLLEALKGKKAEAAADPMLKLRERWGLGSGQPHQITAETDTSDEPKVLGFGVPAN